MNQEAIKARDGWLRQQAAEHEAAEKLPALLDEICERAVERAAQHERKCK